MVESSLNCEYYWFVCFCQSVLIFDSCTFKVFDSIDIETQAISGSNELITFWSQVLIEVKRQRSTSFGL